MPSFEPPSPHVLIRCEFIFWHIHSSSVFSPWFTDSLLSSQTLLTWLHGCHGNSYGLVYIAEALWLYVYLTEYFHFFYVYCQLFSSLYFCIWFREFVFKAEMENLYYVLWYFVFIQFFNLVICFAVIWFESALVNDFFCSICFSHQSDTF